MGDAAKQIPLSQIQPHTDDLATRMIREKIGDVRDLGAAAPPPATQTVIENAAAPDQQILMEKIIAALQSVFDPEIPLNIYDLGLIYKIAIGPSNTVKVEMTLTAPGCPVAGSLLAEVQRKVESLREVASAQVDLVWDPPWTRDRLSEAARLELGLM